jgi:orotate phosphoribosyltransferase
MLIDVDNAQYLAQKLLQIKSVVLSIEQPFTWTSGLKAPIYCDNRLVLGYPELRNHIKNELVSLTRSFDPPVTAIAGVATAGIPHAAFIAQELGLPMAYVRSSAKAHGRENRVEGYLGSRHRILVVEDLISTGGSSLKALETLQEDGHSISALAAIFSYNFQLAENAFRERNIPLYTLTDYETLVKTAVDFGYVNQNQLNTLKDWRAAPEQWGSK